MVSATIYKLITLRQYGQSPQVRIHGSRQVEWKLCPQGKRVNISPSLYPSRHMEQSRVDLGVPSSTPSGLWKTVWCKESRARCASPGGFFFGSCINGGSSASEFKSGKGVLLANSPVPPQSPMSVSLKSSPNVKSSKWMSDEGLLLRLNKRTNKMGH